MSTKMEKIGRVLELRGVDMADVEKQKVREMRGTFANILKDADRTKVESAIDDFFRGHSVSLRIKQALAVIYDDLFDEAEIDAMLAFYASPAGQKAVALAGTVDARLKTAIAGIISRTSTRLIDHMKDAGFISASPGEVEMKRSILNAMMKRMPN